VRAAVFLDRDGVICEEVDYLSDPDQLRLLPGAAEAIRQLNDAGVPTILVTNQSGIGRGYFTAEAVDAIHDRLRAELAAQGASLDAIQCCPHRPDEGCQCRKPRAGLLRRAAAEHGVELRASVMVGDKLSDLEAGRAAGCGTVLVLTGYGGRERHGVTADDHVADDLRAAVEWILAQRKEASIYAKELA
jgi:D-glycero-D-manno-heptose 1,7-bisphosphate phosphatase